MSTTIVYNGVTLKNVLTRSFDQEAVYDESGTDLLYHKFVIHVVSYAHDLGNGAHLGIEPQFASATDTIVAVRSILEHPRGEFSMTVGGVVLLTANGQTDKNNGPKPRRCNIINISGSKVLRIEYEIEIAILECESLRNSAGVLNNRWSAEDDFDRDWYCTRTIQGRLRVANLNLNPQAFRGWVVPPLQDGFQRESMRFLTSTDGLHLDYTIVDKQLYAAPPFPSTTWSADHTESTADGVTYAAAINIRLQGPPKASKKALIQTAAILMEAKLGVRRGEASTKSTKIESVAITDHLHENSIELQIRILRTAGDSRGSTAPQQVIERTMGAQLGKPVDGDMIPGYNQFKAPVPTDVDLASPTGLFICYLQTPCDDQHQIPQAQGTSQSSIPSARKSTSISTQTGTLTPDTPYQWSQDHLSSMYTYYTVDSTYSTAQMKLALPVAADSTTQARSRAIVRLANPMATRTITVAAERFGDWPKIPAMEKTYDDPTGIAVLLSSQVIAAAPKLTTDGQNRTYALQQIVVYSLEREPQGSEMLAAKIPWMLPQASDLQIPSQAFGTGIIN